jgi:nucleoside-diphosphate-sugar epimerase
MAVLVTGGSGFLGSHVVEQLAGAGQAVRALVRKTSDTSFLRSLAKVELVDGAVDDRASVERAMTGVTAVVHVAGLVKARSPEEFMRVNAGGTENMLEAALASADRIRRFVLVSSIAVAGPSDGEGRPVKHDTPPRPVTHYGRSKLAAERAALAKKDRLPITVIRPPAIYGPRDREILAFFKAIKLGVLPLLGSAQNKLSMTYGADCAAACIRAIDADVPSGSVFYVDDGEVHTLAEMIRLAELALGRRAWLRVPLPKPVVLTAARASELYGRATNRAVMLTRDKCNELFDQWVCDSAHTRSSLGWEPQVPFSLGVQRTVDWYKQAGWL